MKLGDERSDEAMMLVAPARAFKTGRWEMKHVRCGRILFERREDPKTVGPQKKFRWVVIEIERPDP